MELGNYTYRNKHYPYIKKLIYTNLGQFPELKHDRKHVKPWGYPITTSWPGEIESSHNYLKQEPIGMAAKTHENN